MTSPSHKKEIQFALTNFIYIYYFRFTIYNEKQTL